MIKIGITGGIGGGKSVVSSLFKLLEIPVYVADQESKKLTESSPEIRKALISRFGDHLYTGNTLDKKLLASLIFSDQDNLSFVNSVIHPVVLQDFLQWTQNQQAPVVVMESAILFESGFNAGMDRIVTVKAPIEIRLKRVLERDGYSKQQVLERMAAQLSDEEKCRKSDFVIDNDDQKALIPQVEKIYFSILHNL